MRTSTAAAILFLSAIVIGVIHGSEVAAAPAKGAQQADNAPNPYAPCSTTDLMTMLGKGGPLQLVSPSGLPLKNARLQAAKLIRLESLLARLSSPSISAAYRRLP